MRAGDSMNRILLVTSVAAEARAIGSVDRAAVIVAGLGRTNAAAATTEALLRATERGNPRASAFDGVISVGVAGALPGSELNIGDVIVASACVYAEEGIVTEAGFATLDSIGFKLGDFPGNAVPVDWAMLDALADEFHIGPIATVATCSGTNAAAAEMVRRTGAVAEAMEGAAVVHAARRLGVGAIELRAISNRTGDRAMQEWDLERGLAALGPAVLRAVRVLCRADAP